VVYEGGWCASPKPAVAWCPSRLGCSQGGGHAARDPFRRVGSRRRFDPTDRTEFDLFGRPPVPVQNEISLLPPAAGPGGEPRNEAYEALHAVAANLEDSQQTFFSSDYVVGTTSRRRPEPNTGDRNSHGSRVDEFRTAKLRRGSPEPVEDQGAGASGPAVQELIAQERQRSPTYDGRSVFGWEHGRPSAKIGNVDRR